MTATTLAAAWSAWVLWLLLAPRPRRPMRASPHRSRVRRLALTMAVVVGIGFAAGPWLAALVVALAPLARRVHQLAASRRAARARAACVPDLGELLRVAVAAGLTPVLAVEQLAELGPPPGRRAARAVLDATARGQPLGDALAALPAHLGATARPIADALAATDRYGVALEPVLDATVADLRRQRRTTASEAARRLPVSLSFPLVVCVLPAFALLTLAPLVAGAFGSLRAGAATPERMRSTPIGAPGPFPTADTGGPHDASRTLDPLGEAERAAASPHP